MIINLAVNQAFNQPLGRVKLISILQMNIAIHQLKDIGQRFDGHS
tara:strand:+ start:1445 stop:1579 length:135 start_codon:yes stop_codon:yes gene_type:complete